MNLLTAILPPWARWLGLVLALLFAFTFGHLRGQRIEGEKHIAYVTQQAAQTAKIVKAQQKVVTQTEIKYRDRIKTIYVKGEQIEKQVPIYVTQLDSAHCTINAGFVRVHRAATTGELAGPAVDSDREASGIDLATVASVDAANNKNHLACIQQVDGWQKFYKGLQKATKGY